MEDDYGVVYEGSIVLNRMELRGTPEQIETLVSQKCENLKNTIMAYVRGDLPLKVKSDAE